MSEKNSKNSNFPIFRKLVLTDKKNSKINQSKSPKINQLKSPKSPFNKLQTFKEKETINKEENFFEKVEKVEKPKQKFKKIEILNISKENNLKNPIFQKIIKPKKISLTIMDRDEIFNKKFNEFDQKEKNFFPKINNFNKNYFKTKTTTKTILKKINKNTLIQSKSFNLDDETVNYKNPNYDTNFKHTYEHVSSANNNNDRSKIFNHIENEQIKDFNDNLNTSPLIIIDDVIKQLNRLKTVFVNKNFEKVSQKNSITAASSPLSYFRFTNKLNLKSNNNNNLRTISSKALDRSIAYHNYEKNEEKLENFGKNLKINKFDLKISAKLKKPSITNLNNCSFSSLTTTICHNSTQPNKQNSGNPVQMIYPGHGKKKVGLSSPHVRTVIHENQERTIEEPYIKRNLIHKGSNLNISAIDADCNKIRQKINFFDEFSN